MSIVDQIVSRIISTQFEDIPENLVGSTKKFLLDTIGVAIAGSNAPGVKELIELLEEWGGKPESTIFVYGRRIPSPYAALANSTMVHARDFDDSYDPGRIHTFVSVFPSTLAIAERRGEITGKEFLTAIILGIDLICRLSLLAIKSKRGFLRTATCGAFGAAVSSSRILGLDSIKMSNALGIVYSQVAGNSQCVEERVLVKRIQPGFSAQAGVISTLLAEKGITGPKEIFKGKYGFFNLYYPGVIDEDLQGLVDFEKVKFMGTDLSFKPYPCCRSTHAGIDAAIQIMDKHNIPLEMIDRVNVLVPPSTYDTVGKPLEFKENPEVEAQFSLPYTIAVALINKSVSLEDFERKRVIENVLVHQMMRKVLITINEGLKKSDLSVSTPVIIEINLKDGKKIYHKVDYRKGSPENPFSWGEVIEKFNDCVHHAAKTLKQERVERLVDVIMNLEHMEDVSLIAELIA